MQKEFGFNGQEIVAIMGAHTLGKPHVTISLYRYNFKTRSGGLFNNGYYRNMVKKPDWFFDGWFRHHDKSCSISHGANSSGQRPIARWLTHVRGDTSLGGPVQWLQQKFTCPTCEHVKQLNMTDMWDSCCEGAPQGSCKAGCDGWRLIRGNDETMLNSDAGLYYSFDLDADGFPTGCNGFQNFNPAGWGPISNVTPHFANSLNTWSRIGDEEMSDPECGFNMMEVPAGSKPLHEIVREYADDGDKWVADFVPTLEKMLSNGYSSGDLELAPADAMTDYQCTTMKDVYLLPHNQRQFECTKTR
jgi:hypothetical protein